MIRILHVTEPSADFQTRRSIEHLAAGLGPGFAAEVRTIGPRGDWRDVFIAAGRLRRMDSFDIVHTWSGRALWAAALAGCPRVLHSPSPTLTASAAKWVQAIMAFRNVQLIVPTLAVDRAVLGVGIAPERCHVIHPPVDFSRIRRRRNAQLREQLGFSEDDYVLLAAGESTKAAAHQDAAWAAGILHVLDPRYRLLLWGRGDRIGAVETFDRKIQPPGTVFVAQQRLGRPVEFEELLPAADMIVNSAIGTTPSLPLMIAMAAGLPIVSTVTYTAAEFLEDHRNALLTPKRAPRKLAQRILQLREDAALQWRLSDTARTEAYERYSLTRFLDEYRARYRDF